MHKSNKEDSSRPNRPGALPEQDDTELDDTELDAVTGGTNDTPPTTTTGISTMIKKQHDANMTSIKNIKV